ncbi:hypothetical protein [Ktedonosporobacter rubrisoli]|nr:hypothetical protein [Ktedonosporobacter rubrisoli]
MQAVVLFIIGFFILIFVGSFLASILSLWLQRERLKDLPTLKDIHRSRS